MKESEKLRKGEKLCEGEWFPREERLLNFLVWVWIGS